MKKLVIWDFDGVIADSESVWMMNRQKSINEKFNLHFNFKTFVHHFDSMSDELKKETLLKMGYKTSDTFWKEQQKIDRAYMRDYGLDLIKGVKSLIPLTKHCIATGDVKAKTLLKLKSVGLWNTLFDKSNLFTGDMVKETKPAPDVFLYAMEQMKEKAKNCIVIEDSVNGVIAAQKAKVDVIAFIGNKMYRNNQEHLEQLKKLKVKHICSNMKEVKAVLLGC